MDENSSILGDGNGFIIGFILQKILEQLGDIFTIVEIGAGTGIIATFYLQYRMFNTARKFVHSLKLKNQTEWNNYCKSGLKPKDIPTAANSVYKNKGWVSLGDWLGNNVIATQDKIFCSYEESKKIAQKLNIKKVSDWKKYARSKNNKLNVIYFRLAYCLLNEKSSSCLIILHNSMLAFLEID